VLGVPVHLLRIVSAGRQILLDKWQSQLDQWALFAPWTVAHVLHAQGGNNAQATHPVLQLKCGPNVKAVWDKLTVDATRVHLSQLTPHGGDFWTRCGSVLPSQLSSRSRPALSCRHNSIQHAPKA